MPVSPIEALRESEKNTQALLVRNPKSRKAAEIQASHFTFAGRMNMT